MTTENYHQHDIFDFPKEITQIYSQQKHGTVKF